MTGRRTFLKDAVTAGAAAAFVRPSSAAAQTQSPPAVDKPSSRLAAAETVAPSLTEQPAADVAHVGNPGSDFMVDMLRVAGIEYVAAMPGSTFRGIHESIVNYGGNRNPGLIVCTHEEASAAIAHGYAKVAGKPMACLVHSTVGLQHASMAIYNAWCDRVPMIVIAGNIADATKRRPGVEWYHTALDLGALVRDYTKYDDSPVSLQHYAESFARAYTLSVTPPMEPVLIVADAELQERPIENREKIVVPCIRPVAYPVGGQDTLDAAARVLCAAKNPLIVADRAIRSQAGMEALVKLAESLNAPVIDLLGRMNFPTNHYLNQTWLKSELVAQADVILALEVGDVWGLTGTVPDIIGRPSKKFTKPDVKVISISTSYLYSKSNTQDAERYFAPTLAIGGDGEASLSPLIRSIGITLTSAQRSAIEERGPMLRQSFAAMREAARNDAMRAWDASPVSTARLSQEVWQVIKNEDWALVSSSLFISNWPQRLWDFTKSYQYNGAEGAYGEAMARLRLSERPSRTGMRDACPSTSRLMVTSWYCPGCSGRRHTTSCRC
ncbi:thiamine pyrophosphate-binding protein (plasmid) [Burkholderia sp. M6-3]